MSKESLHLRLPATSANLGPCFDAAGLAMTIYLEIDAAESDHFSIEATGRSAEICSALENNLLLETYRKVLQAHGAQVPPLQISVRNEIPLGMGCGSSAATLLAAVAMAAHFGDLGWSAERILTEASLIEGHPDNTAACWLGGFTVATLEGEHVHAVSVHPQVDWKILLVLPERPLATASARAVLPPSYSRADTVANIQRAAMLAMAFSASRGDLLRIAMQDRIHQPYRGGICSLLPRLLPLAGHHGILGVALSGAGPGVLLVLESHQRFGEARQAIVKATAELTGVEVIESSIEGCGAAERWLSGISV